MQNTTRLVKHLIKKRPSIREIDFAKVNVPDPREIGTIYGGLAEALVKEWLARARFVQDKNFPRYTAGLECVKANNGVTVYSGNTSIHQFDFLARKNGLNYAIEVKSMCLNNISSKISRYLALSEAIYGEKTHMLLFFPTYSNKINDAQNIESHFPGDVTCVDLGYKKKDLRAVAEEYRNWRLDQSGRSLDELN